MLCLYSLANLQLQECAKTYITQAIDRTEKTFTNSDNESTTYATPIIKRENSSINLSTTDIWMVG